MAVPNGHAMVCTLHVPCTPALIRLQVATRPSLYFLRSTAKDTLKIELRPMTEKRSAASPGESTMGKRWPWPKLYRINMNVGQNWKLCNSFKQADPKQVSLDAESLLFMQY